MFKKSWALALLLVGLVSGCTVNRDIMFKTDNDHVFDTYPDTVTQDLRIQPNDVLEFRLFANDGFKMIDLVTEGAGQQAMFLSRMVFTYNVEFDGLVKLPLLGRVPVSGRTVRQAETYLEGLYTEFYNRPFVQIQVINRRVVVFPGGGGDAQSIPLENNNTTLVEAIGMAGGFTPIASRNRTRIVRMEGGVEKIIVVKVDQITRAGKKIHDVIVRPDDIIVVPESFF